MPELQYDTRNLNEEETDRLLRKLTIELGTHDQACRVLGIIAEIGAGVFMAKEKTA